MGLKSAKLGRLSRAPFLVAGALSLGLGVVGLFLPLVPTTVFMLIAAYFFSRSSPRLHSWLVNHRCFGAPIRNWQLQGAIARKAKAAAVSLMLASVLLSFALGFPPAVLLIQLLVLLPVSLFILTRSEPLHDQGST